MIRNSNRISGQLISKLLIAALLVANAYTILHGVAMDALIPNPAKGVAYFFHEELLTESVSYWDTTEEYIYFLYRSLGVVSAYDWDGNYRFSVCFDRSARNGGLYMKCEANHLYVNDKWGYEYIIQGEEVIKTNEPGNGTKDFAWYTQEKILPLTVKLGKIYDEFGRCIMDFPGRNWWIWQCSLSDMQE